MQGQLVSQVSTLSSVSPLTMSLQSSGARRRRALLQVCTCWILWLINYVLLACLLARPWAIEQLVGHIPITPADFVIIFIVITVAMPKLLLLLLCRLLPPAHRR